MSTTSTTRSKRPAVKSNRDELLTKKRLKEERGWTDGLIRRFLPDPDEVRPNPHYSKAAPMRLYRLDRIERIEATAEFREAMQAAQIRSQAAQRSVEKRRQDTLRSVESLPPPPLPKFTPEELRNLAVKHYNELWAEREDFEKYATVDDTPEFLARITVNYVRHQLTDYERHLLTTRGRVGVREADLAISERIFNAIAEAYPWLKEECWRQQDQREARGLIVC